jgi:hypothetical protein
VSVTLALADEVEASEPTRFAAWPGDSALTMAPGDVSFGLLSQSSWGVTSRLEVRLHPVLFWVMPHAEAKLRWFDHGRWQLSSSHRLAYPTPFLSLIAREGTGGLLPPTTDVPHTLLVSTDGLASLEWRAGHWATLRLGAAVAVEGGGDDVLLDFPILYQRFAALSAPWVPQFALGLEGVLGRASYAIEFRHYWLPLDGYALLHANEYAAEGYVQIAASHRVGVGGRLSQAHLPVGWRSHFLPHVDYQLAF